MKTRFVAVIIIFVACVFAYFNSLSGDFVWDDNLLIKDNYFIQNISNITKVFTIDFWEASLKAQKGAFYRPVVTASLMIDHLFYKNNPIGYHLTNIILHILTSIMVLHVCLYFFSLTSATLAALVFAVHPIHTESVAFISGRTDICAALFLLISLYFFILTVNSVDIRFSFFSGLFFLLALLCKEAAVAGAVMILFLWGYFKMFRTRKYSYYIVDLIRKTLPYVLALIIYIFMRKAVYSGPVKYYHEYPAGSALYTFLTMPKIWFCYVMKLFYPVNLSVDYAPEVITKLFSPYFLFPCLFFAVLIGVAIWCYFTEKRLFTFVILWFVMTILPASNIIPIGILMADRFLYIPSFAFAFLAGYIYDKYYFDLNESAKRIMAYSFFIILALFLVLTVRRNFDWKDNQRLWLKTAKTTPASFRAHGSMATMYMEKNMLDDALREAKLAAIYRPGDPRNMGNIGVIYMTMGNYDSAIDYFEKSIALDPADFRTYANLYLIYNEQKKYDLAFNALDKATQLSPNNIDLWKLKAQFCKDHKLYERLKESHMHLIELIPTDIKLLKQIAQYYQDEMQDYPMAVKVYKKIIQTNSDPEVFTKMKQCMDKITFQQHVK